MTLSQQDFSNQMQGQLQRLDPAVSNEVGTPERKIIDTVSQSLADAQVDLNALRQGLDINSKIGDNLDRFLSIFNFGRQKATYATGFATFSRITSSNTNIVIAANTQIQVPITDATDPHSGTIFYTTGTVTLVPPATSIVAPIQAVQAGSSGNVDANTITQIVGDLIPGITSVTNPLPLTNGSDRESDDALKVRFNNTVFRNLAGTQDQYLALAVSSQYSTKAIVVGSQSLWQEYVQVPQVADNSAYDVNNDGFIEFGNGIAGEYSTALSIIPRAKFLWNNLPVFISGNNSLFFYRPDIDFEFNTDISSRYRGDAYRIWQAYSPYSSTIPNPLSITNIAPSFTFTNVYIGDDDTVQSIRPGDILLAEYSYLSDVSRNNPSLHITNAVDVFVDGIQNESSSMITLTPRSGDVFTNNPSNRLYYENFRRAGSPNERPLLGSFYTPMFQEPTVDLPDEIVIQDNVYTLGVNYHLVEDISELAGSIRARNGIEWLAIEKGDSGGGTDKLISEWSAEVLEIDDYSYNKNLVTLQGMLEGSRQITTDVLSHQARPRYFKFDITVMYSPGASATEINSNIHDAVQNYFASQYFGTIVQLSDILDIVHNVNGVDNVRWSTDTPFGSDSARVYDTDNSGNLLLNSWVEDIVHGVPSTVNAVQRIFIAGQPDPTIIAPDSIAGDFNSKIRLTWANPTDSWNDHPLDFDLYIFGNDWANALQTLLLTRGAPVSVTEDVRPTSEVRDPIRSFTLSYTSPGPVPTMTIVSLLKGGPKVIYNDFILGDNEFPELPSTVTDEISFNNRDVQFPADSVPGFIIRSRAQNTFIRS